jgi:hypothetical protein
MGSTPEKNRGRKPRATVPLKYRGGNKILKAVVHDYSIFSGMI